MNCTSFHSSSKQEGEREKEREKKRKKELFLPTKGQENVARRCIDVETSSLTHPLKQIRVVSTRCNFLECSPPCSPALFSVAQYCVRYCCLHTRSSLPGRREECYVDRQQRLTSDVSQQSRGKRMIYTIRNTKTDRDRWRVSDVIIL